MEEIESGQDGVEHPMNIPQVNNYPNSFLDSHIEVGSGQHGVERPMIPQVDNYPNSFLDSQVGQDYMKLFLYVILGCLVTVVLIGLGYAFHRRRDLTDWIRARVFTAREHSYESPLQQDSEGNSGETAV